MSKIKIFALGGQNENGKNMYVVDVDQDIFIFDAGLKYADDKMLGVDYIIPNYDYLKENKDRIKGIFITHGHDEQMGAIPDMLVELPDINIYATTFTMEILKRELEDEKIIANNLFEIQAHKKINFGKNSIFPISLTHSVPDAVGYVLYTEDGAIFYTGNYVFDSTMLGSYKTDIGKLAYVGKQGVICLMSESLYAERSGFTSPNHRISSIIRDALYKNDGRVLYNIFQAEMYRIQELFNEVRATDRKIVVIGKKLETIITKAIEMKYIEIEPEKLANISSVNDENVVLLISDEREKPYSNINRIVRGYDKFIKIKETDTIIFAAPIYEGLEKSATKIFDNISKVGANLIEIPSKKYAEHHASSEDIMLMLDLMQPKYFMPVIGEFRSMVASRESAKKAGLKEENVLLKLNGQVAVFEGGVNVYSDEKIKVDDILIDGKTVGDVGELVLKDRELLSENGVVIVTVTLDKRSKAVVAGPIISSKGFVFSKNDGDTITEAEKITLDVIKENTKPNYIDYNKVKTGIRDKMGKYLYKTTESKPMILVVIQEI